MLKNYSLSKLKKIEKINQNKVISAVAKAKKDKFLNMDKSIKLNFVKSYSKIIKNFSQPSKNFKEKQKETKLSPY